MTSALVPAIGSYGSIVATWAYSVGAPRYTMANALNVGTAALNVALALALVQYCKRENARRDRGERDGRVAGLDEEEVSRLGSRHPSFRYLI